MATFFLTLFLKRFSCTHASKIFIRRVICAVRRHRHARTRLFMNIYVSLLSYIPLLSTDSRKILYEKRTEKMNRNRRKMHNQ